MSKHQPTNPMKQIHKFTHNGDRVLLVKCVPPDGKTYSGFQWPLTIGAKVVPVKHSREATCDSGGLFGWPWGLGIGDGKSPRADWIWLVFSAKPENVIGEIEGPKAKVVPDEKDSTECALIEYVGTQAGAMYHTMMGRIAWIEGRSSGSASATGNSGSASATGDSGSASATGYSGSASATGNRGSASATGYSGSASATGERGIALGVGEYCTVEVKNGIAVVTADRCLWRIRPGAVLVLRWEDPKNQGTFPFKLISADKLNRKDGSELKFEFGKLVKKWS